MILRQEYICLLKEKDLESLSADEIGNITRFHTITNFKFAQGNLLYADSIFSREKAKITLSRDYMMKYKVA